MTDTVHLEKSLSGHTSILLAYSGGLDSTVLLHQLVTWRDKYPALSLRAIHVHHGLSPRADEWLEHCQRQCQSWQVPLIAEHVELNSTRHGIEAAAREARYQAFLKHLNRDEVLVTAQHQDDQCETLLLALKRGSGPAGLAAMPEKLYLRQHILIRPLLSHSRHELERWARQYHLTWIEDESNQDTRFDRNFLRQEIIPLLQARWPQFAANCTRSARLCGEQEQLLDELLTESLNTCFQPDGGLYVASFGDMSEPKRNAILRRWIAHCGGNMPSYDAVKRLWNEVISSRHDASPRLQMGEYDVRRFRQALYWVKRQPSLKESTLIWPDLARPLSLPQDLGMLIQQEGGEWIRPPETDEQVNIRFQVKGDIHIAGRSGGRVMKKLWQELNVPPWLRERTPLVFYDEQLIMAPGLFITRAGVSQSDQGISIRWLNK